MGGLLRDFMRPRIGRTGINALWGRGDRAIPQHGAHFPCVDRPLDVAWAGSQPDDSKGVGWVGGWGPPRAMQWRQGTRGVRVLALRTSWLCSIYPLESVCALESL